MFRDKQAKVLIFLVCMILGIMLATQFKSAENAKNSISQQRVEDLAERLRTAEKDKATLAEEVKKLHKQSGGEAMALEITALRARAGETAMEGPGVKVTLDDSTVVTKPGDNANLYIIHDDDLLRLINELRAAGAEALAVNKERLLDISEIRCAGPTVSVNNNRFSPPYQIIALGEPKTLEGALRLRGGVIETLKFWGITVKVEQSDNLTVPAFKGTRRYDFAKVKEGASK
jgi:uncharacterized protein YlxW (UPF0749 family)